MPYSEEQLKDLENKYETISSRYQNLITSYWLHVFKNPRAKEHATHGFSRRVGILKRCIDRTFELLPPDRTEIPTKDEISDATINLHAFVFNVFGITDNLAWLWVHEKDLKKPDGAEIYKNLVGLGKKSKFVRDSFSPEFQRYLETLDKWFAHQADYRHALAHRISLYIPPYMVRTSDAAAYKDLEARKYAAITRPDFEDEYRRLSDEQDALAWFDPIMTHSYEENARLVLFHAQMIADFLTIEELGQKMLEELDR